jgi:hypothetical protein
MFQARNEKLTICGEIKVLFVNAVKVIMPFKPVKLKIYMLE